MSKRNRKCVQNSNGLDYQIFTHSRMGTIQELDQFCPSSPFRWPYRNSIVLLPREAQAAPLMWGSVNSVNETTDPRPVSFRKAKEVFVVGNQKSYFRLAVVYC